MNKLLPVTIIVTTTIFLSLPLISSAAVVGTCNSDAGCKTLKRACDEVNGTVQRHGPGGVGGNGSCDTKDTAKMKMGELGLVANPSNSNKMVVLD